MEKVELLRKKASELMSHRPQTGQEILEFVKKLKQLITEISLIISPMQALTVTNKHYPEHYWPDTLKEELGNLDKENLLLMLACGNNLASKDDCKKIWENQIKKRIKPRLKELISDLQNTEIEYQKN